MRRIALLALCLPLAGQDSADECSFTLDNGLRVWIKRSDKVEFAVTMIVYRTGLRDDPEGRVGLASVVQRMIQSGATPSYKAGEAQRTLQDEGYTLQTRLDVGGEALADVTYFYSVVRASAAERAVKIEAERMRGVTFDDALLASATRQLRLGIAASSTGHARVFARFAEMMFPGHPYARPRLGREADIERVTLDDVRRRYNERFHPDNAVLLVYGKVDVGLIRKTIETAFRDVPKKGMVVQKLDVKRAPGLVRKEFEEAVLSKPLAILGYLMPEKADPASPAMVLLGRYLGTALAGERDLRPGVQVEADPVCIDRSALLVYVQAETNDGLAHSVDIVRAAIRRLQDTPLSEVTLKNYKKSVLSFFRQLDHAYFPPQPREQVPANCVGALLRKAMVMHAFDPDRPEFLKNLEALTPQAVREAAKEYLSDDNLTLALFKRL